MQQTKYEPPAHSDQTTSITSNCLASHSTCNDRPPPGLSLAQLPAQVAGSQPLASRPFDQGRSERTRIRRSLALFGFLADIWLLPIMHSIQVPQMVKQTLPADPTACLAPESTFVVCTRLSSDNETFHRLESVDVTRTHPPTPPTFRSDDPYPHLPG